MKKSDFLTVLSLILILAALLSGNSASAVTLDEYLTQVKQESLGYKSTSEQSEASSLKSRGRIFILLRVFSRMCDLVMMANRNLLRLSNTTVSIWKTIR